MRQDLPVTSEGFEAVSTRWHGLQTTIRLHYTAKRQPPYEGAPGRTWNFPRRSV